MHGIILLQQILQKFKEKWRVSLWLLAFFFRCARCGEFWLDDPDLGPESIETESGEIICQYCAEV